MYETPFLITPMFSPPLSVKKLRKPTGSVTHSKTSLRPFKCFFHFVYFNSNVFGTENGLFLCESTVPSTMDLSHKRVSMHFYNTNNKYKIRGLMSPGCACIVLHHSVTARVFILVAPPQADILLLVWHSSPVVQTQGHFRCSI